MPCAWYGTMVRAKGAELVAGGDRPGLLAGTVGFDCERERDAPMVPSLVTQRIH